MCITLLYVRYHWSSLGQLTVILDELHVLQHVGLCWHESSLHGVSKDESSLHTNDAQYASYACYREHVDLYWHESSLHAVSKDESSLHTNNASSR